MGLKPRLQFIKLLKDWALRRSLRDVLINLEACLQSVIGVLQQCEVGSWNCFPVLVGGMLKVARDTNDFYTHVVALQMRKSNAKMQNDLNFIYVPRTLR